MCNGFGMKNPVPLISAIVLVVGLAILAYLPVRKLYQYSQAWSWVETQAQVTSAKLKYGRLRTRRNGRPKTAYQAVGAYRYSFEGVEYTGHRLTLHDGLSTDREPAARRVSHLKVALRKKRPVIAYVNPRSPDQAVLDRSPDWFGIIVGSILGLVFSGAGAGMFWIWKRTQGRYAMA